MTTAESAGATGPEGDASGNLIVVGVDSSAESAKALRWAAAEARLREAPLELVLAWRVSAIPPPASMGASSGTVASTAELEAQADEQIREIAATTLGADYTLPVTHTVKRGHAAEVLVEASDRAALLVVGSRGLGGFAGMLLGSVSHAVVLHARCPVVVVRHNTGS